MNYIENNGTEVELESSRQYLLGIVGSTGHLGTKLREASALWGTDDDIALISKDLDTKEYKRLITESEVLLLSLKQDDLKFWLHNNQSLLADDQILMSIGACTTFAGLETHLGSGKIGRCMTSIRIAADNDVIEWTSNTNFTTHDIQRVKTSLGLLGETKYVGIRNDAAMERKMFEACGIGGLSLILNALMQSSIAHLHFSEQTAAEAIDRDLEEILRLRQGGVSYEHIQLSVETKGGITRRGNEEIEEHIKKGSQERAIAMKTRATEIAEVFEKGSS